MKFQEQLKWNPAVPTVLLAILVVRGQARGFPLYVLVCGALMVVWCGVCLYRMVYRRSKWVASFPPLSEADAVNRIGRARMDHFLPGKFGFVWISEMITKYGYPIGMMFRDKPQDRTFSGWTFISGHEDDWRFSSSVDLHDAQVILRCEPSIEQYLDLPPGTVLTRRDDGTFVQDEDAEEIG